MAPLIDLHLERNAGFTQPMSQVDPGRSHSGQLVLSVRADHPLVQAALDRPGPERELLLLELVREGCAWSHLAAQPLPLVEAQARLMAQRIGG